MDIREACLKAQRVGKGITRKSYGSRPLVLLPTNTENCVIMIPSNNNEFKAVRWDPSADDLLAEDWYVYG